MPQEPLPAPANRVSPPNLISPMLSGTATPSDVIAHQKLIDYADSAIKGVNLGRALAQLPREGAENATQKAYAEIAKEHAKSVQAAIKQIQQTTYSTDPAKNAAAQSQEIQRILAQSGISFGQGGGSENPNIPVGIYGKNSFIQPSGNQPINSNVPAAPINYGTNAPGPANPGGNPPNANVPNAPIGNQQQPQQPKDEIDKTIDQLAPTTMYVPPAVQNQYLQQLQGGVLPAAPIA